MKAGIAQKIILVLATMLFQQTAIVSRVGAESNSIDGTGQSFVGPPSVGDSRAGSPSVQVSQAVQGSQAIHVTQAGQVASQQAVILSNNGDSPELIRVSTPVYKADTERFVPPLGTYTFKVGWQGIPAATLTLTTERQGMYYRIVSTAKTLRAIDLFYKLRYRADALISAEDFMPVKTTFDQLENSTAKLTEITYLDDGRVHTLRRKNDGPAEETEFDPHNFMLEPFSAAFLARSLDWAPGIERQFDTFNGKTRYLITFKCVDQVSMNVNGQPRSAWVIVPTVVNVAKREDTKKLRQAKIYVTSDERREVLKISSEVFIGSVSAWLDSFEPASEHPSTVVAERAQAHFVQ